MEGSWGTRPRLPLTAGSLSLHARASCWHPPERHPEHGLSQGTVVLELKIDLGNCQQLVEIDPMMKTWQNHYDSAWAPFSAVNPGDKGKEENWVKDPKRISVVQAIAGNTGQLRQGGFVIGNGKLRKGRGTPTPLPRSAW